MTQALYAHMNNKRKKRLLLAGPTKAKVIDIKSSIFGDQKTESG
jgi:hypothetical protein